jgi:hypothetical protein
MVKLTKPPHECKHCVHTRITTVSELHECCLTPSTSDSFSVVYVIDCPVLAVSLFLGFSVVLLIQTCLLDSNEIPRCEMCIAVDSVSGYYAAGCVSPQDGYHRSMRCMLYS